MDTKQLRQKILELAIHGKLVPQDPNDEPASVLLERIKAEKERLVKEGKIKKSRKSTKTSDTPHYENVPFEIPDGWEWCSLEDICIFLSRGKSPKYSEDDKTYPVFAQKCNLKDGGISLEQARFLDPSTVYKWDDIYKLQTGDVLVNSTGTGTVGRTRLFDAVCLGNYPFVVPDSHVSVIRTSSQINSKYIFAYISSKFIQQYLEDNLAGSTNQKELYIGVLSTLRVAIPSFAEQTRIVSEIERWFTLIDQIEQGKVDLQGTIKQTKSKILDLAIHGKLIPQDPNDEPASELLKRINPAAEITCDNGQYGKIPVGWYWCQFGEYLDVRDGTHDSPKYVEKGYPFVTSKNLSHGKIDFDTTKFISEEDHIKFSQRSFVEDGDILFAMIGSIGNPVLIVKDREFSIKNVALFKPYDRKNTYMEYVLYYLLYIQETLKQDAKGGMQPFIPLNYFRKDLHIPLPPIEEQHRIVTKIEELFTSLDNIQKALEV